MASCVGGLGSIIYSKKLVRCCRSTLKLCFMMARLLLFVCCVVPFSFANNIDIEVSPIIKRGNLSSYFGFSATGVVAKDVSQSWVAVGGPRANTTKFDNPSSGKSFRETGALYKCPMSMDQTDCSDITQKIFDNPSQKVDPANGWYGVSVAGGRKNEDNIMVCSHRPYISYCYGAGCKVGLPGCCVVFGATPDFLYQYSLIAINRANAADKRARLVTYKRSRFGQTGISSLMDGNILVSGAVGERSWTGAITDRFSGRFGGSTQHYAYGGYSLATGAFFETGKTAYASGAPRYNVTGAVFLYDTLGDVPKKIIYGLEYGSYFGMSLCSSDFNGDTFSEIVVGAPYVSESLNKPATGAVYVFSNENNFKEPVHTLMSKNFQARALFGKSVAALGDVDLNGYNDLGVGAPYEGQGGALYIYHGSKNGLSPEPVQIIRASGLPYDLHTFGWTVRGETDLDGNGYPDIVVGAYASDSIMILRSVPVVEVKARYRLSPNTIEVSNRNCTVNDPDLKVTKTVCFDVEILAFYRDRAGIMKGNIDLSFLLEADTLVKESKNRRVRFESSGTSVLSVPNRNVQNGKETEIIKTKAYLRTDLCPDCPDKINPFPDVRMDLTYLLPDRVKPTIPKSGKLPSLEKYFQLPYNTKKEKSDNGSFVTLPVKRACGAVCVPNLMIKNSGTMKIPVQSRDVLLEIEVSNSAEQAYDVKLRFKLPPPLKTLLCKPGVKTVRCTLGLYVLEEREGGRGNPDSSHAIKRLLITDKLADVCLWTECDTINNFTVCRLGNIGRKSRQYAIRIDTSQASAALDTYLIPMNVSSANPENTSTLSDNMLALELTVSSEADIAIRRSKFTENVYYGGTVRGQFSMTSLEQIGLPVEHRYVVSNQGPDLVPKVNITIEWPYEAKSGKHLLYLVSIEEGPLVQCFPKRDWVNMLASQFETSTIGVLNEDRSNRTRRDVDEAKEREEKSLDAQLRKKKGSGASVVLDCRNDTAKCIEIPCTVTNLKAKGDAGVTIKSRIWNGTLLEDYTDQVVEVFSRARIDDLTSYVTDNNLDNHEAEISTSFIPSAQKTTKKGIQVWIIVVSAIAGVVLLVILIVIFKMCGFFNRMETDRYDHVPGN